MSARRAGRAATLALTLCAGLSIVRAGDLSRVKEVRLQRDDGKGEPGEVVTFFRTTDHRLHFDVALEGVKTGQTVAKWKFVGVDTEAGANVPVGEYTTTGHVVNEIHGSVKLERDWPAGTYRADLFVDGQLLAPIAFEVRRPADRVLVREVRLRRDDRGHAGPVVKAFRPQDRRLHLEVETAGLPAGARVSWTWRAVDTEGGKDITIGTVESGAEDVKADVLSSHCDLPRAWPKGRYEAEVSVNGKPLTRVEFRVE